MPDLGPQAALGILVPFVQPAVPDSQEPVPGWVLRRQRKPVLVCDSSVLKVLVPKVTGGACFSSLLEPSLHPPCPTSLWTPLLLVLRFCGSRRVQLCARISSVPSRFSRPQGGEPPRGGGRLCPSCPWELSLYPWAQKLGWTDPVCDPLYAEPQDERT